MKATKALEIERLTEDALRQFIAGEVLVIRVPRFIDRSLANSVGRKIEQSEN